MLRRTFSVISSLFVALLLMGVANKSNAQTLGGDAYFGNNISAFRIRVDVNNSRPSNNRGTLVYVADNGTFSGTVSNSVLTPLRISRYSFVVTGVAVGRFYHYENNILVGRPFVRASFTATVSSETSLVSKFTISMVDYYNPLLEYTHLSSINQYAGRIGYYE